MVCSRIGDRVIEKAILKQPSCIAIQHFSLEVTEVSTFCLLLSPSDKSNIRFREYTSANILS
jgi:hypothetical protein